MACLRRDVKYSEHSIVGESPVLPPRRLYGVLVRWDPSHGVVQDDLHVGVLVVAQPFIERDDGLPPPQAVGESLVEVVLPPDESAQLDSLDYRIQVRMVQYGMNRSGQRDVPEEVPGDVWRRVPAVLVMVHHGEYPQAGDVSGPVVQTPFSVGELLSEVNGLSDSTWGRCEMAMLRSPLSRLKMLASTSNLVNSPQRNRTSDFPCATITWSVSIEIISQMVDDVPDVHVGQVRDASQVAAHVAVAVVVVSARPDDQVDGGHAPVSVGIDTNDVHVLGIQGLEQRGVVRRHDQLSGDLGDHLVQQVQDQLVVDAAVELVDERHPAQTAPQYAREQGDQLGYASRLESMFYAPDASGDESVEAQAVL